MGPLTETEWRKALLKHWYCGLTPPGLATPAYPVSSYVTGQFIKALNEGSSNG